MKITERIETIINQLEDAASYEDFALLDEARKELVFLLQDMESDFLSDSDEDY
jgi:hypothetical protein|tara:strand:+ start:1350 stop:1508 length:159 start_codon:yes stop_codon:yes gene_type:complete